MRISDDRYRRDQQRLDVAVHFIEHEARTRTIRHWTGLSDDRIRKLYRSYLTEHSGESPTRHRGKSPQQAAHFTRTARLRQEAALLASLYLLAGVLPATASEPRAMPDIPRARLLCLSYDTYRALTLQPQISFEHAVFLLTALGRADEVQLAECSQCAAVIVADRLSLRVPECAACSTAPAATPPHQAGHIPH